VPTTLSENELLEDLAREIGTLLINGRVSDLQVAKLEARIFEMQNIATSREEERAVLLERLKRAEDARTELAEQIRGKNKTKR
jgi:hypothetical protein